MHRYKEAHDLLPDSIVETLPRLNATDGDPDRTVMLKWFTPDSSWAWYVIEYDRTEKLCFWFGRRAGAGVDLLQSGSNRTSPRPARFTRGTGPGLFDDADVGTLPGNDSRTVERTEAT